MFRQAPDLCALSCSIKNKHSLRPIDLLPPPPPPTRPGATSAASARSPEEQAQIESDEAVRTLIRRAEAEIMMGNQGAGDDDVADEDDLIDADDVASDD